MTPPGADSADAGTVATIPVQRGQTTTYDVTLPAIADLTVSFHHADGKNYNDCMVIRPAAANQYDGSSGNCAGGAGATTFELAPGSYTYTVNNGSGLRNEPDSFTGSLDIVSGANTLTIDVPVLQLGTVTGVVTDATTGAPLAGVTVSSSDFASTTTGADGRYSLADVGLDGNDVSITATAPDPTHQTVSTDVTVIPGGSVTVDFALPLVGP